MAASGQTPVQAVSGQQELREGDEPQHLSFRHVLKGRRHPLGMDTFTSKLQQDVEEAALIAKLMPGSTSSRHREV
jgi:hypothetical protein